MPRGSRSALLLLVVTLLAAPSFAARLESGSSFTLLREESQVGDLYFAGNALRLDGRIEGSVAAGCQSAGIAGFITRNVYLGAQTVSIPGTIQGDLNAACLSLSLDGPVGGAARIAASTVSIASRVNQDLVVVCRDLTIARTAEIAGDVIVGCGTLNINGTVHGDVRAAVGEIVVSGIIDGDLIATVGTRLVLTQDARIFGSVRYKSDLELDVGNKDAVFGEIKFTRRLPKPSGLGEVRRFRLRPGLLTALFLPFALLSILGALAVGFILLAVWRHPLARAIDNCLGRFGRTVGTGALGLLAGPVALILAAVLVITLPAGIVGLLLYLVFLYLAKILAGMFLGRWLFRLFGGGSASPWLTAPAGIILVYALCAVPVVGWLAWLFALVLGFGVIIEILAATRRT